MAGICFRPLFSIKVEHAFFANATGKGIELLPTDRTEFLFRKLGLISRGDVGKISVYYQEEQADRLWPVMDDPSESLDFSFRLVSSDPYFSLYTYPSFHKIDGILYFDSGNAINDGRGVMRLHGEENASERDLKKLSELPDDGDIAFREKRLKPAILVNLRLNDILSGDFAKNIHKHYLIRLDAQKSLWKYYLMGKLDNRVLRIADVDNSIAFNQSTSPSFLGGRKALSFVSSTVLPMREVPGYRFQLLELKDRGHKTLIKRLPNASVKQVSKDELDGNGVYVSEIYVNCQLI